MLEKAVFFILGILTVIVLGVVPALLLSQRGDTAPASFIDVPQDHTQHRSIGIVGGRGLMIGDGTGNFNPDHTMTRCEAAVVMVKLAGDEPQYVSGEWCADWLQRAIELGFMPPISVEQASIVPATRGDIATLIALALAAK